MAGNNGLNKRTAANRKKFLEALGENFNVAEAARAAGLGRTALYNWRREDADFRKAWDDIKANEGADLIEDEIARRGLRGVDEPVIYQGRIAGAWVDKKGNEVPADHKNAVAFKPITVRKYSDTCLMALANANLPHKYRQRHEHTGANGGPIETKDTTAPEELARRVAFILTQGVRAQEKA